MATAYYVDNAGSDSNPGTVGQPWQTCSKVNSVTLVAGDQIIFTAGQTFTGPLTITNSGASGNYICIGTGRLAPSTAGTGRTAQASPATITCPDGGNGINLNDCEYVSLDNLIVSGSGVNTSTGASTSTGMGMSLYSTQASSQLTGVRVTACTVTGTKDGIWAYTLVDTKQGYADLQVWGCLVYAIQRQAIYMVTLGDYGYGTRTQNSDVYVGYCHVYDCPGLPGGLGVGNCGGGIIISNCTTGTIEYCTVYEINLVGDQGVGGTNALGAVQSDGIIIQFCEAYHIYAPQASPIDGCGIDFETGAQNCYAQYNYLHDCDGAGYLTGATRDSHSTLGNIVRFNVFARNCVNGGNPSELHNFGTNNSGSPVSTTFYNNTVYASYGDVYRSGSAGDGNGVDALVNCILVSAAGAFCVNSQTMDTAAMYGNLYYAIGGGGIKIRPDGTTYTSMAALRGAGYEVTGGSSGVNADPLLSSPTSGTGVGSLPGLEVTTMRYFDIAYQSPAKDAGVDISGIVTLDHDFHNQSCSGHGANIGACIPQRVDVRLPFG